MCEHLYAWPQSSSTRFRRHRCLRGEPADNYAGSTVAERTCLGLALSYSRCEVCLHLEQRFGPRRNEHFESPILMVVLLAGLLQLVLQHPGILLPQILEASFTSFPLGQISLQLEDILLFCTERVDGDRVMKS